MRDFLTKAQWLRRPPEYIAKLRKHNGMQISMNKIIKIGVVWNSRNALHLPIIMLYCIFIKVNNLSMNFNEMCGFGWKSQSWFSSYWIINSVGHKIPLLIIMSAWCSWVEREKFIRSYSFLLTCDLHLKTPILIEGQLGHEFYNLCRGFLVKLKSFSFVSETFFILDHQWRHWFRFECGSILYWWLYRNSFMKFWLMWNMANHQ